MEEPAPQDLKPGQETGSAYNIRKTSIDPLLATCYGAPFNKISHTLLSHNHIMLILRAFLTEAAWELPEIPGVVKFCDDDGKLSITAVAASPNGEQLAEIISEGIFCEVLSSKMDVEEPNAASTISEALNYPNSLAMRTSELPQSRS